MRISNYRISGHNVGKCTKGRKCVLKDFKNISKIKKGIRLKNRFVMICDDIIEVGNTDFSTGFKTDRTTKTNLKMFEKYCPDGDTKAMIANGNFVNKQLTT